MTTQTVETRQAQAARRALARSAGYQVLSQATVYPSKEVVSALREEDLPQARTAVDILGQAFSDRLEALAKEMQVDATQLQTEHRKIFTHILSLDCPPCETVYTSRQIFEETQELSDIAGFYRAFGLELAERERLDHISVELEFMQFLTFKEAYAQLNDGPAKARLCREAQRKFVQDHLGRWALRFAQQLERSADGGFFGAVASLVDTFLSAEIDFLRARPEAIVVDANWRTQSAGDDGCPAAEGVSASGVDG
jgi:DMSO reductase family type II enzyme chaperone